MSQGKTLKIIVAPNALKGSLSAHSAAKAMGQGVKRALTSANIILKPIADGGDGFAKVLVDEVNATKMHFSASGPLGKPISTAIHINKQHSLAIIEMATIAGLALISPKDRNPLLTTSFGLGEAIQVALEAGVKQLIIGIGGSATNDAGIGMLAALGVKFSSNSGAQIQPIGDSLEKIAHIDISGLDARLSQVTIDIACDVDIPLYGKNGAAQLFAAQKGADAKQVRQLDDGLRHFAHLVNNLFGINIGKQPGAGAAGGVGAALSAFCGAKLNHGIDIVLDTINFNEALKNASLVLTAEGQLDNQTQYGKAPAGVAKRAHQHNIPCLALAGSIDNKSFSLDQSDFTAAFSICPGPSSLSSSMEQAFDNLSNTSEQVIRTFVAGKQW